MRYKPCNFEVKYYRKKFFFTLTIWWRFSLLSWFKSPPILTQTLNLRFAIQTLQFRSQILSEKKNFHIDNLKTFFLATMHQITADLNLNTPYSIADTVVVFLNLDLRVKNVFWNVFACFQDSSFKSRLMIFFKIGSSFFWLA